MNVFDNPKVIRNLVDRCYSECSILPHIDLSSHVNLLRKAYIADLVIKQCLELPTQGLMVDWLKVSPLEYDRLMCYGHAIEPTPKQRKFVATPLLGQCHASAAFHWVLNPGFKMYSGFSDQANFHSWLMEGDDLYETTPIHRESYYGYLNKDPLGEVLIELDNIERIAREGDISAEQYAEFKMNLENLIKTI